MIWKLTGSDVTTDHWAITTRVLDHVMFDGVKKLQDRLRKIRRFIHGKTGIVYCSGLETICLLMIELI